MTICDMKRGESAVVIRVELEEDLRARLASLRVFAGAKITLLRVSLLKHTYLVKAGSADLALEREIARGVRVWKT